MTIPILALDVDGVLIEGFPSARWDKTMEADLGISPKAMQKTFFKHHWDDVIRGKMPIEEPLGEFLASVGSDITVQEFIAYWHGESANLRDDVVEAAIAWQDRTGGHLALATNQDISRAKYLKETLGLGDHFQTMIVSCDIGTLKPEADYFVRGDELLGRTEDQVVIFLDDLIDNVNGAIEHGWDARHTPNPDAARACIEALGVP